MPISISVDSIWTALLWLFVAWLLALPIAWHRERSLLGLRTLPLVAVASCGYLLVGVEVAGDDPNAQARLLSGLMSGIGFIGGGAILKSGEHVRGTATAAAVWATGAVGGAIALDRLELAVSVSAITFLTFLILTPLGRRIQSRHNDEDGSAQEEDGGKSG